MQCETCLVTGVAGFVGSQLAERLIRDGRVVIGLDCFADYYPRWLKERNLAYLHGHERFHFLEGDLLQVDLGALLGGKLAAAGRTMTQDPGRKELGDGRVGYIFHLAAQAGVRESWGRNFEIYVRNNILATQRLLEAAKEQPLKRFVYASSSSVYGDAEAFPTSEDVRPRPVSPYGVTKLAGEHLVFLYGRNYGVPVVGLRYFTVYGPRQRPDMAFHRFIQAIRAGQEITVYGDGEQTRDFTYVDDAVDGTVRAAFADVAGEVFNIGGGSRVSVNEVIQLMETVLDRPAHVRYAGPGHGDVRHTSADTRRAADLLSYEPRMTLADGLRLESAWLATIASELDRKGEA